MYIFGGVDAHQRRRNDLHRMWLRAPSLKEQVDIILICEDGLFLRPFLT